jgi:hypothetical protein
MVLAAEHGGGRDDYLPPRSPAFSNIFSKAVTGTRNK